MNKALFLDRDGVINIDKRYLSRIEDVEFIPGIFDVCRHFGYLGYLIIIISNQAGIARGLYSEQDLAQLMQWMLEQFEQREIGIAKVYYCSHHPEFTGPCECRKPAPGMFFKAKEELDVDMEKSISIGDKTSDAEAGLAAGVENNFLLQNENYPHDATSPFPVIGRLYDLIDFAWSRR